MYSTTGRTTASRTDPGRSGDARLRERIVGPMLLLAGLACALAPSVADAARRGGDKRPRLLILRVESTAVADPVRRKLTSALAARAKQYRHYRVVTSRTDLVEEMFEFECTEAGVECLSNIGKKYKAAKVIYSEMVKDDAGKLQWSMRLVQMKGTNEPIARVAQSTVQPLAKASAPKQAVKNGLLVLIGPVDLPQKRTAVPGTMHVQLVGGGVALVYVDDKLAGRSSVSGLKVKLAPGTYRIRVVRAGFKDWNSKTTIKSGKTKGLTVELETAPIEAAAAARASTAPKPVPVTSTWWFWTAVAAGAVTAGVVIYAVTRPEETKLLGNAAFSMDSDDAHFDPVFAGQ